MVVKSQIKLIKSLQQKKYRNAHGMFVAEGIKMVNELLDSDFKVYKVYTTEPLALKNGVVRMTQISDTELQQMSGLKDPNRVLGVFYIPGVKKVDFKDWIIVLDNVRDPGNLGTVIRLCDWFGIRHLVCSPNTVDCFNPKVLQATMGSISRVNVVYTDLIDFFSDSELSPYGTFMDGSSVYTAKLPKTGILILGNEANGISPEIEALIPSKIGIPQFGKRSAESLNVATATAILLSEIRRGGLLSADS